MQPDHNLSVQTDTHFHNARTKAMFNVNFPKKKKSFYSTNKLKTRVLQIVAELEKKKYQMFLSDLHQ